MSDLPVPRRGSRGRMRDMDDDVKAVAASVLTPITAQIVDCLSRDELATLLEASWDCLGEGADDLGSSVGAVMDLLGWCSVALNGCILIPRSNDRPRACHCSDGGPAVVQWTVSGPLPQRPFAHK